MKITVEAIEVPMILDFLKVEDDELVKKLVDSKIWYWVKTIVNNNNIYLVVWLKLKRVEIK